MQVACLPMTLITAAFEGSKVCQIYQKKKGEKRPHLIFSNIWGFPGSFNVKMVKQQLLKKEKCVITIQLLCNTHSSIKKKTHGSIFFFKVKIDKYNNYLIMELRKIYCGTRKNMLAFRWFCKLAPQERSHFIRFQILLHIKSSSILQIEKFLWKSINSRWWEKEHFLTTYYELDIKFL